MNLSCDVIHDLLPLYYDKVCTDLTRDMVDEHLLSCDACSRELADLQTRVGVSADPSAEAAPLRALAALLRRRRRLAFLLGVFAVSVLGVAGCLIGLATNPGWVDADGLLHEPFALIPLGWMFGLIAVVSGAAALVVGTRKQAH